MILTLNNIFWFDSQTIGLGSLMAWGSYGGTAPPPTGTAIEDRISVGTIFGAQLADARIGGL